MYLQLDAFRTREECEVIELRRQIELIRQSQDKQRKALFARNGELMKRQMDLESRLQHIERGLCSMSKSTNMC